MSRISVAAWLSPFGNQAVVSWLVAGAACVIVSLATPAPRPDQVTDELAFNWRTLNIFADLGDAGTSTWSSGGACLWRLSAG